MNLSSRTLSIIAIIAIGLTLVIALLIFGGGLTPTPTPTINIDNIVAATMTQIAAQWTATPQQTQTPQAVDDSWARVQSAGVLKVGTSADYPPFAYYNEDNAMDGFDIALIQAIGEKLGVQVDVYDFAFEGLAATLRIGQTDVIIAALSVAPEREPYVEFSNVYYVGEDAVLTREGSNIAEVSSPTDFANKRLGVQRLTMFEVWARSNLVDTGIISEEMLFSYESPDLAIKALEMDELDLVLIDFKPAMAILDEYKVKIVGSGINMQRFAMMVNKGSIALQMKLNEALIALQNEGKLTELNEKYLGLKPGEIIPPPVPTSEVCLNGMSFVSDLNYDDNNFQDPPEVAPGQVIEKGWRIRNTGTCTWTTEYFIDFVRGDRMQGEATKVERQVLPGDTYDIFVILTAPNNADTYNGFWQMHNNARVPFGQTIWVSVEVVTDEPTATQAPPEPTQTQTPSEATATETPPEPTATEEPPQPENPLPGNSFYIMNLNGSPPIPGTEMKLDLVFYDDEVTAFGGCNTFTGSYIVSMDDPEGGAISFSDFSGTQALCEDPPGIKDQEQNYINTLLSVDSFNFFDVVQFFLKTGDSIVIEGELKPTFP